MKTFTATQIDNNLVEIVIKGFDGTLRDMIFKTTINAMTEAIEKYNKGALIQEAFHFLTVAEREFLISGITPAEWDKLFGTNEQEVPPDDD